MASNRLFCGETADDQKKVFWLRLLRAGHWHNTHENPCMDCGFSFGQDWVVIPEDRPNERISMTVVRVEIVPPHPPEWLVSLVIERM